MKFSLFLHMERLDQSQSYQQLHDEFVQLAKMADTGGMHAIWTGEHHGMDFTIAPNPFLNLVDLAHHTKNVRLGTGTIIAPFWHPIKLAGEAAMSDILTQGRLDLGIARGAYNFEYERLMPGMDAMEAGGRMRELVPAVQKLWQGDYVHDGKYSQFPATTSAPKPLQAGGVPMWIAARDPNSHNFAVENGCNVQVTPLWMGIAEIESLMQRFQDAKANHPKDKNGNDTNPKILLLQHTYVGKDEADLVEAAKCISRFYCYFGSWFKNERPIQQGQIQPLSEDEMAKMEMYAPEKMRENMPIGTPDQVIRKLKHYEQLGYDEFAFWIDSSMSFEQKRDSLRRFIDEVMPAFA
ncbi:LLM class flavin-dependent oxidoreductase [Psychrobacter lutiphocae]|uniref:LLM class flavin-dependent oxidoreductase n=1 Tax=Psychrobacter lutiphocae TaxID=540500 RepID=UPI0003702F83|nr:LLM class flavin-dependent oxidoreductase [Psychrobacter lutiphocae]